MIMPCSLRGTNIEALQYPIVGTSIMLEFLVKNLLGNMPLILTNKLFKSPSGLIFECSGIVRDVPIEINKTEVHLDFQIFAILDIELVIGYPFEKLFQKKPTHGSLGQECGKTASATHLENPMAEHYPNHNPFEEVKFISPFISHRLSSETKHPSPTSLEPKPCPSGHQNGDLDSVRDSTLTFHDIFPENKNYCAMDNLRAPTLELKKNNSTNKQEGFPFETLAFHAHSWNL